MHRNNIIGELQSNIRKNRQWALRCLETGDLAQAKNAMKDALTHEVELAGERLDLFTKRTEPQKATAYMPEPSVVTP